LRIEKGEWRMEKGEGRIEKGELRMEKNIEANGNISHSPFSIFNFQFSLLHS
jgi:hypothetical protein